MYVGYANRFRTCTIGTVQTDTYTSAHTNRLNTIRITRKKNYMHTDINFVGSLLVLLIE